MDSELTFEGHKDNEDDDSNKIAPISRRDLEDRNEINEAIDVNIRREMLQESFVSNNYMRDLRQAELLTSDQEIELGKQTEPMICLRARKTAIERQLRKLEEDSKKVITGKKQKLEKDLASCIEDERLLMPAFEAARNEFIEHNLRWVIAIGKRYMSKGVAFSDIIQDGNIGLIIAAEKYNWRFGFRFSTYAAWWIRQSIARSIITTGHMVRLPSYVYEILPKLMSLQESFINQYGRKPTYQELTEQSGYRISVVERLLTSGNHILSLETNPDSESSLVLENVLSDKRPSPEDVFLDKERREGVAEILDKALTESSVDIIRRRFGFDEYEDDKVQTLEEIGHVYNRSRERMRQRQSSDIKRLSLPHWREKFKEYL